jgi:hypothetical protein
MIIGGAVNFGPGIRIISEIPPQFVTSGLLFNLDMQNYVSGTNWPDSSGNSNNFTFSGTPTVANSGTPSAYWNNNSGSLYATAASAIFPAGISYSKGIVVRGNGSSFGTGNLISSTGQEAWYFNGGNTLYGGNNNGDGVVSAHQTSGSEAYNIWYYLSMTFTSGVGWQFYVNGSSVTTTGPSTGKVSSTPQVGAFANGYTLAGGVGVAHVYTRALTAAEHLQNYNYYQTRYSGSTPT